MSFLKHGALAGEQGSLEEVAFEPYLRATVCFNRKNTGFLFAFALVHALVDFHIRAARLFV